MNTKPLESYRHLWDGSEPGWKLAFVEQLEWEFIIHFKTDGPSLREISAMRKMVDELRDQPAIDVFNQLRRTQEYRFKTRVGNISSYRLRETAERLSLKFTRVCHDLSGYIPISSEGNTLLIEDNDLSKQVTDRMLAAGVPVVDHVCLD